MKNTSVPNVFKYFRSFAALSLTVGIRKIKRKGKKQLCFGISAYGGMVSLLSTQRLQNALIPTITKGIHNNSRNEKSQNVRIKPGYPFIDFPSFLQLSPYFGCGNKSDNY